MQHVCKPDGKIEQISPLCWSNPLEPEDYLENNNVVLGWQSSKDKLSVC